MQKKKLLLGIIPVVLLGFSIGYILWHIIFEYPPHRYSLDFNGAQWISTGDKTPNGYFVKEIFIPDNVADAWISIAATDNAELFVNEEKIAIDTFLSVNLSDIHNVTGKLRHGKNVVAAYVYRMSYPGPPRLLLKGGYTDLTGREHIFVTDGTWKVSSVEETQGRQNVILWHFHNFDHSRWKQAQIEGTSASYPVYTSEIAPYILGKPLSGRWMWHPEPTVRSAYFLKSFTLRSPVKDAIVGIAGSSIYNLTINGTPVKKGNLFEGSLDIYDITPLLHSGQNTIGVGVTVGDTAPGLFVEGYIHDRNSVINLTGDVTWRTISNIIPEKYIPDINSSAWKVPLLLSEYPSQPWGVLSRNIKKIDLSFIYIAKSFIKFFTFIFSVIAAMLCIWFLIAFLYAKITNDNLLDRLFTDGVLHIPSLLFIFFIYLIKFDVRFDSSFPFKLKYVLVSLLILFLLRSAEFISTRIKRYRTKDILVESKKSANLLCSFLVICLITTGFLMRIHGLTYLSLNHDEVSMMEYTQGFLERGFPSKVIGPYVKPMTTYELEPYSIAPPVLLFGYNDFGGRFHSVFWGTLEILILYILGKTLFNRLTGLLAAAVQTFLPFCVIWSQAVFYPQLTQFMTTLTVLFFYKAIDANPLRERFLYLTALSFGLMYLSWEGSGFLLVAMLAAIVVHKGSDLSWLRNKHAWASFAMIFLTVFIQQSRRLLYLNAYLLINGKIADISLPQLFFLDPMYDPYFYIDHFFLTENNWLFTIFLIAGIFLLLKHKPLRYLYIILFVPALCLTNLLPVNAPRYIFNLEPFLILTGSAVIIIFMNSFRNMINKKSTVVRFSTSLSLIALAATIFLASNTTFLKLYLLSKTPSVPPDHVREDVTWTDFKSTSRYIKENMKKGDIFIMVRSFPLEYYDEIKANYAITTYLRLVMFFDTSEGGYPGLIDKYIGTPIIKNPDELKEITAQHNRVWFVSDPDYELPKENDRETVDYIKQTFKVVYESYRSKIYLWEK